MPRKSKKINKFELALEKYYSLTNTRNIPSEIISEDFSYMYKKKFWVLRNLKGLMVAYVDINSGETYDLINEKGEIRI